MTDVEQEPLASEPRNASLLERLRAQRAAQVAGTLDIAIPTWGASTEGVQIIMRLRRIPWKGRAAQVLHNLQKAAQSENGASADRELGAECDLLIAGLDQLYARDGDSDPVPLDPDEPMRFDMRTAEALGIEATRAREVVVALFGGDIGQFALKAAAARYLGWLQQLEVVSPDEGKG